jgi:hypothetical protein
MSASATFLSTSTSRQSSSTATFKWSRYARRALATTVAAVAANTAFYYLAQLVVSYDPTFVVLANPMGAISFTLVPAIVASLMYAPLARLTRHAVRIFEVIAAITFVVTLIPDFTYIPTVDGSSPAQTAVLVLMHVIAAITIVRGLTRGTYVAR